VLSKRAVIVRSAGKTDVEFKPALDVAFWAGPPVVEALEIFQAETRALVQGFEPEFGR
jgi:hypothetical protein